MKASALSSERAEALERVNRLGLTQGQIAILKALEAWFDENPEPPKNMQIIAEMAEVSRALVWVSLPVLESLDYILVHRNRRGNIKKHGVVLMMAMGEEDL